MTDWRPRWKSAEGRGSMCQARRLMGCLRDACGRALYRVDDGIIIIRCERGSADGQVQIDGWDCQDCWPVTDIRAWHTGVPGIFAERANANRVGGVGGGELVRWCTHHRGMGASLPWRSLPRVQVHTCYRDARGGSELGTASAYPPACFLAFLLPKTFLQRAQEHFATRAGRRLDR